MTSGSSIWQSFVQGDKASLKQLMELHYKALFHYGAKYSADEELIKDCIQELFIVLWKSRTRLSTEVNPKPYLIASLRRAIHRKLQTENRLSKYKAQTTDFFDFELSIEQKIVERESNQVLLKKVAAAMAALPKRQKEVIYLKFFQNLSRDEIATVMGNNPQTVSNLLQLALKKLRIEFQCTVATSTLIGIVSYLLSL